MPRNSIKSGTLLNRHGIRSLVIMLQEAVRPSRRTEGVEYVIRDVVAKAEEVRRTGKKIMNLNIGNPVKYG